VRRAVERAHRSRAPQLRPAMPCLRAPSARVKTRCHQEQQRLAQEVTGTRPITAALNWLDQAMALEANPPASHLVGDSYLK
jgi:hypothetical protein